MKTNPFPHILLASSSPRRIEMLNRLGFRVRVHPPKVNERRRTNESAGEMVLRLARLKAHAVCKADPVGSHPRVVISADTTVVAPNGRTILGKPASPAGAARMLSLLAGKTHQVFTAYCIVYEQRGQVPREIARVVKSRVSMRALDKASIRAYVASKEPMDKAGSYAAQGLGMALVESIEGSYFNVVGLPIAQVLKDIERLTGRGLFEWVKKR